MNRTIWHLMLGLFLIVPAAMTRAEAPATQPATQPAEVVPVDPKNDAALKAAMGKTVAVEGIVTEAKWGSTGKVLRIKLAGTQKTHFMAIIFKEQREMFDKANNGDVAKALTGATIHVEGPLTPYKGDPEIIIKTESQLKVTKSAVAVAAKK